MEEDDDVYNLGVALKRISCLSRYNIGILFVIWVGPTALTKPIFPWDHEYIIQYLSHGLVGKYGHCHVAL